MARAATFDWDDANKAHIARHGVTPEDVEQAFANHPLLMTDAGRALQFVYTLRRGKVRVITAHTAKKKVREKL